MNPGSPMPQRDEFDQYLSGPYCYTEKVQSISELCAWFDEYDEHMKAQNIGSGTLQFPNDQHRQQTQIWDQYSKRSETFDSCLVDTTVEAMSTDTHGSFSYATNQIVFEENPLPGYTLGSAEVTPRMFNTTDDILCQMDFSAPSPPSPGPFKKIPKTKSSRKRANLPRINVDEWLISDESNGRKRRPLLYEFLRLLLENRKYSHVATYIDKSQGIFKFHDRKLAAQLWQIVKGRNSETDMTYEKLARAIRYYYNNKIMSQTPGRFTFRFGEASGFEDIYGPAS